MALPPRGGSISLTAWLLLINLAALPYRNTQLVTFIEKRIIGKHQKISENIRK